MTEASNSSCSSVLPAPKLGRYQPQMSRSELWHLALIRSLQVICLTASLSILCAPSAISEDNLHNEIFCTCCMSCICGL